MCLNTLSHLCTRLPDLIEYKENFSNDSIYATIQEIALPVSNSTWSCKWQEEILVDCSAYYVPILTEEGVCFSFNSLNSKEIYTNE